MADDRPTELAFKPSLTLGNGGRFPIVFRLFSSDSDKSEIYGLRYRAYRQAGWIEPSPDEQLRDAIDELPSTLNVAAYSKDACVGSLRLAMGGESRDSKSMPCRSVFPEEIAALRRKGYRRLVEFSRFAVEPGLANQSFRSTVLMSLVRAGLILCYAADVDYAVIAVHKRFSRFHTAMFGFEVLGASDAYIDIEEPTDLLGRAFQAIDARYKERNAFFRISADEVKGARAAIAAMGRMPAFEVA